MPTVAVFTSACAPAGAPLGLLLAEAEAEAEAEADGDAETDADADADADAYEEPPPPPLSEHPLSAAIVRNAAVLTTARRIRLITAPQVDS
ncbi:hypothetical protein ABT154_19965 [Streptomyces sp. NPDC001728]|uniref:hypothetical protein n=1 Tax=Streptomyces sp. NPDC001728 TaxID=3154396 RepID=UPI00332D4BF2